MKVDFSQPILGLDNTELRGPDGDKLTLSEICSKALINANFENIDADTKQKRGNLALKIYNTEEPIQLKVEEISLIKETVAQIWSPLVIARAFPLLDEAEG